MKAIQKPLNLLAEAAIFLGTVFFICTACFALDINQDPTPKDYFFGRSISCPIRNLEKIFHPDRKNANFTFFQRAQNVTVEGGKLVFTLAEKEATIGWGNYLGQQPIDQIEDMWQQIIVACKCLSPGAQRPVEKE